MRAIPLGVAGALLILGIPSLGRADEPIAAREPHMMSETAEITTVADAFDEDDPFDLNLVIGFSQSWKRAHIRRETQAFSGSNGSLGESGGFIPATQDIATYTSSTSTLLVGADVGIYRDLALLVRLPVILGWSQSLGDLNGSQAIAPQLLQDQMGGQLFSLPFNSPTRSGVDYISLGLDWAIYNQQRDHTKPTWVIGVEGRLAVGTPLHACNANPPSQVAACPDPVTNQNRDPGISRGMNSIIARTVWSRRLGYVEPYSGFWAQADFPTDSSDFGKWNPTADLARTPPLVGSFALGLEVIPYEHREQYQRLSADFRFKGTYHSPGRDYSELFDALGSSQSQSFRTPNPAAYMANPTPGGSPPSIVDPGSQKVYFTGVTEQQAYGSFTLSAAATWQAGEYIKLTVGSALTYAQPHLVTAADSCNPNITDPAQSGPCRNALTGVAAGAPNPDHRDVIDLPGHRFSVDDTTIVDLYVMGIVMF